MKFVLLFACLAIYVANIQAVVLLPCKGLPSNPNCLGGKNEGHSFFRHCARNANEMWYWDSSARSCLRLRYKGCGGNRNRHCHLVDCNFKCNRR